MLGVAQHAGGERGIVRVPAVDCREAGAQTLAPFRDRTPNLRFRKRVTIHRISRAGEIEAALVGKVRVERMALHAGAIGDHADRRRCWADAAVQIHGGFHDALPGLGLLLGAAFQGVSARHFSLHKYVHPLLTVGRISLYIPVLSNLKYVYRPLSFS